MQWIGSRTHDLTVVERTVLHITRFFGDYKKLEKKEVSIEGFDGPEKAKQIIKDGIQVSNEPVLSECARCGAMDAKQNFALL